VGIEKERGKGKDKGQEYTGDRGTMPLTTKRETVHGETIDQQSTTLLIKSMERVKFGLRPHKGSTERERTKSMERV
jgi:hypothetical protein